MSADFSREKDSTQTELKGHCLRFKIQILIRFDQIYNEAKPLRNQGETFQDIIFAETGQTVCEWADTRGRGSVGESSHASVFIFSRELEQTCWSSKLQRCQYYHIKDWNFRTKVFHVKRATLHSCEKFIKTFGRVFHR